MTNKSCSAAVEWQCDIEKERARWMDQRRERDERDLGTPLCNSTSLLRSDRKHNRKPSHLRATFILPSFLLFPYIYLRFSLLFRKKHWEKPKLREEKREAFRGWSSLKLLKLFRTSLILIFLMLQFSLRHGSIGKNKKMNEKRVHC